MKSSISYSRHSIDAADRRAVNDALKSDFLTQGVKVAEFEKALAEKCGARYAVVLSSGTTALHGAYAAAGISRGDEVLVPAITFAATANAALYVGARPVFVDVQQDTGNIDPEVLGPQISKKTKAIVPVHFAGHACDMKAIAGLARKKGLLVIEDACHALGAWHGSERIGGCHYSDMTVFSFHPLKSITTGEGGAVLTNSRKLYQRLITFRSHGITKDPGNFRARGMAGALWYHEMQTLGYNYRMTDIQCALGISQLKKLDRFIDRRRSVAAYYQRALRSQSLFDLPVEKGYTRSSWHLYPIRLKEPDQEAKRKIFLRLRQDGVGVQVHYLPVYWHPYYQDLGYARGLCPKAEDFYLREISIPIFPSITLDQKKRVVKALAGCQDIKR